VKRNLVICGVFLVFAAVYISSVAPAYNSDDSPETTLAFYSMGIQHPPGYPLNTLLGKIFTFLPAGSLMMRANLMAVFFNLFAGLFIFFIVREMAASKNTGAGADIAGLAAVVLYIFSVSAWLQSTSAKGSIYALNAFMTAACLWSLFRLKSGARFFYLFCFLYGLSLGNHWTSMLVIAPGIIFYLFSQRRELNIKKIVMGAAFAFLGAGIYLYIFLRSTTFPMYAWGDTKTLNDLLWLISRAQYASAEQKHTISDTVHLFSYYAKNFTLKEYPFFLSLLFMPGAVMLFKRRRNEAASLMFSLVCLVFSVVSVATPPKNTEWLIKPYLVSANIFAAIFAAMFLYFIFQKLKTRYRDWFFCGAAVLLLGVVLHKNNPHYDRYYIGYDYSKNITLTAGKNAIVFTEGDMNIGAILYETLVKKEKYAALIPVVMQYEWYRRQVTANYPGMFTLPANESDMKTYIKNIIAVNSDKNIYYSNVYTERWLEGLTYYPEGMLYRIKDTQGTRPVSDLYLRLYSYRGLLENKTGYDEFTQRLVLENYSGAFNAFADTLRKANQMDGAIRFFKYGLIFNSNNSGAIINMGLAYYYSGNMEGAARAWQQAIDLVPAEPLPYINMAFVYIYKKELKTAMQYVDKALKADPYNQAAMKMKADLNKQGF
jgi:tetratricopeptide (TPR) repeat protein